LDRLAAHVIATAALTVTLATVPVLFADASHAASTSAPANQTADTSHQATDARNGYAGSDPFPALPPLEAETETGPRQAQAQSPAPAQAPSAGAAPGTAPAGPREHPRRRHEAGLLRHERLHAAAAQLPCADRHEVGAPGFELYHGMTAFSVRTYYSASCHSYYGYSFAWLQFRNLHVRYDVGVAVYDAKHDAIEGARTYVGGAGGPVYWSAPIQAAKGECVQAEGHYFYYPASAPGGFEEGDTRAAKICV
jgi:hypothetical protein